MAVSLVQTYLEKQIKPVDFQLSAASTGIWSDWSLWPSLKLLFAAGRFCMLTKLNAGMSAAFRISDEMDAP